MSDRNREAAMSTKKKVIVVVAVGLGLLLLWTLTGPTSFSVERKVTSQAGGFVTWRGTPEASRTICGGVGTLRGWAVREDGYSPQPIHLHRWRYGYWSGSFCSNPNTIFSVLWGGEPDGWPNQIAGWSWQANDSRVIDYNNKGDVRYKAWRGHFTCCLHVPAYQDWPWLRVVLKAGQAPILSHGGG